MSKIEWTEHTWNPLIGCTKISEGCKNCYAERMAKRLAHIDKTAYYADVLTEPEPMNFTGWNGRTKYLPDVVERPLVRQKPTIYFVCSMSDLFHEDTSFPEITAVAEVMQHCPQHTFLILTKRPKRAFRSTQYYKKTRGNRPWPDNVIFGTSISNQKDADKRIPWLLRLRPNRLFVSAEPLLDSINLQSIEISDHGAYYGKTYLDALTGIWTSYITGQQIEKDDLYGKLDQVIVGGESGPGARPMHPAWARSLRDQCQQAGTPYFFKQWGEWAPFAAQAQYDDAAESYGGYCGGPVSLKRYTKNGKTLKGDKVLCEWKDGTEVIASFISQDQHRWGRRNGLIQQYVRVGKKMAGRTLDGRTHDELIWRT